MGKCDVDRLEDSYKEKYLGFSNWKWLSNLELFLKLMKFNVLLYTFHYNNYDPVGSYYNTDYYYNVILW